MTPRRHIVEIGFAGNSFSLRFAKSGGEILEVGHYAAPLHNQRGDILASGNVIPLQKIPHGGRFCFVHVLEGRDPQLTLAVQSAHGL